MVELEETARECLRCVANTTIGRRKKQAIALYVIILSFFAVLYVKYRIPRELYQRKEEWVIKKEMESKIMAFKLSLKERWSTDTTPVQMVPIPTAAQTPQHVERKTSLPPLNKSSSTVTQQKKSNNRQHTFPNVYCTRRPQSEYLYCQHDTDPMKRALDLVNRLTIKELIDQTYSQAPAIPRLKIKGYNWRSNCLHGWSQSKGKWTDNLKWTVFPAPIGLAATFDVNLVRDVAKITATEGRALHNEMLLTYRGSSTEAAGLNCFSPNINLLRDPRWGRAQETFGEDPFLISVLGTAYTRGLQEGPDDRYLLVASCAKHFAVHSGPENLRYSFISDVSMHDLYDTYLPAFRSLVMGAKVSQIMPAYSSLRCEKQVDGAPNVANPFLLKSLLREEFRAPNISVCSDFGALEYMVTHRAFTSEFPLAAALSMNATNDIDLGNDLVYPNYLKIALQQGLVSLDTIKNAVTRSFYLRIRLGDFDPPSKVPYQLINRSHLNTDTGKEINLRAARESIVLLKNANRSLPIDRTNIKHLVVMGPNAFNPGVLLSNYEGLPAYSYSVFNGIVNAMKSYNVTIQHSFGCDNIRCETIFSNQLVRSQVAGADYVVMVMGLQDNNMEGESIDRVRTTCDDIPVPLLGLPGCQTSLVEMVSQISKVILVLVNGGALSTPKLFDNPNVVGIVEAFYPGAYGGVAVADVIFGDYNPSGKMPATVYESEHHLPAFTNYHMNVLLGRTYKYFKNKPLVPFGFGLSYADFVYKNLTVKPEVLTACSPLEVKVSVGNASPKWPGDEVVQVYLVPLNISLPEALTPLSKLVAFNRTSLKPGQTNIVSFVINAYMLSLVDVGGDRYLYPGMYQIQLGVAENYHLKQKFEMQSPSRKPERITACHGIPECMTCET